jgi:hypothetical protein
MLSGRALKLSSSLQGVFEMRLNSIPKKTNTAAPIRAVLGVIITVSVALAGNSAAQAATVSGTFNTSAAASPSNQSFDGTTYFNAPSNGPFSPLAIGEFDFSLPAGFGISGASISGNFGSNILGSGTSQATLYLNGISVATCDALCESASQSSDVSWSHTFTTGELATLSGDSNWVNGKALLSALQQSSSQIVLDPTSITLTTAPVPEPQTYALMGLGLALIAYRRRNQSASRT